MNVIYIHGHAASPKCFDFIRKHLDDDDEILMEYDSGCGFFNNYEIMLERLSDIDDIVFIAHSLGGIYALHLTNCLPDKVLGAITLSTPYEGCIEAGMLQYLLPFNPVFQDIHPSSTLIATANKFEVRHPWTNVVTTCGGLPFIFEQNDGVVTHASMCHRKDISLVEV